MDKKYTLNDEGKVVDDKNKEVVSDLVEDKIAQLLEQDAQKEAAEDDEIDYDNINWDEDQ